MYVAVRVFRVFFYFYICQSQPKMVTNLQMSTLICKSQPKSAKVNSNFRKSTQTCAKFDLNLQKLTQIFKTLLILVKVDPNHHKSTQICNSRPKSTKFSSVSNPFCRNWPKIDFCRPDFANNCPPARPHPCKNTSLYLDFLKCNFFHFHNLFL